MKKCPYCAEEIQDEAIKCKHCGEFLDGAGPPRIPAQQLPWYFSTVWIVVALFSVGPLALPMIWWHPRLSPPWKITITVAMLALTWLLYWSMVATMKYLNEQLQMLNRM